MNRAEVDRLGDRLRIQVNAEDLTLLDAYRREFQLAYTQVANQIRAELGIEVSGRPAKSTSAIIDKLHRGSMRFSQMQDIAGCRIVVASVVDQDQLCSALKSIFSVTVFDRRSKPSHGYRAVHVVVTNFGRPVEIQVRTALQHAWAEYSEKAADIYDHDLKYGLGPEALRRILDEYSLLIAEFEHGIEDRMGQSSTTIELKQEISAEIAKLTEALPPIK